MHCGDDDKVTDNKEKIRQRYRVHDDMNTAVMYQVSLQSDIHSFMDLVLFIWYLLCLSCEMHSSLNQNFRLFGVHCLGYFN